MKYFVVAKKIETNKRTESQSLKYYINRKIKSNTVICINVFVINRTPLFIHGLRKHDQCGGANTGESLLVGTFRGVTSFILELNNRDLTFFH